MFIQASVFVTGYREDTSLPWKLQIPNVLQQKLLALYDTSCKLQGPIKHNQALSDQLERSSLLG